MNRWLGLLFLLPAVTACQSVEWRETPLELQVKWRGHDVYHGDHAYVLATDEDYAEDTYLQLEKVVETMRDVGKMPPGKGLVLAVSFEDPLLLDDPAELMAQASNWHSDALGKPVKRRSIKADYARLSKPQKGGFTMNLSSMARLWCGGIPKVAPALALPSVLVDRAAWIVIMPTTDCMEEVASEMVDAAMKAADLNFFQRMLLAPFMPMARGTMVDELQGQAMVQVFRVCFAHVEAPEEARKQAFKECLAHEGLSGAARGRMSERSLKRLEQNKAFQDKLPKKAQKKSN